MTVMGLTPPENLSATPAGVPSSPALASRRAPEGGNTILRGGPRSPLGSVPARKCCNGDNLGPAGATFPVGSFPEGASWCGALDMAGNVWQWCADWFSRAYYAASPEAEKARMQAQWDRINEDYARLSETYQASKSGNSIPLN